MLLSQSLRLNAKAVVSFVGAGGKTTALLQLAEELAAKGQRVIVTTTTRLFAAQLEGKPFPVLTYDPAQPLPLDQAFARRPIVAIVGNRLEDKVTGVPTALIDELAARPTVDAVLVEADGARMKPFKAPAAHEPVVPPSTTILVPVVGATVFGKSLNEEYVHRPELAAPLAGAQLGEPVTPLVVARVLAHADGGLKGKPEGAQVRVLVNQVESEDALAAAQSLARLLLDYRAIDAVAIGAVANASQPIRETHHRVAAIVLAAGAGTRMGERIKQLLPWQGKTLIENAIDIALNSTVKETVVVLGAHAKAIRPVIRDLPVRVVINPVWAEGHSTSIRTGLGVLSPQVDAAVFINADQPRLTPEILDGIIQRYRETDARIVAPLYAGKRGSPVLFQREHFGELMELSGEQGGRDLLQKHPVEYVAFHESEPGIDIDSPEDYARLVN